MADDDLVSPTRSLLARLEHSCREPGRWLIEGWEVERIPHAAPTARWQAGDVQGNVMHGRTLGRICEQILDEREQRRTPA